MLAVDLDADVSIRCVERIPVLPLPLRNMECLWSVLWSGRTFVRLGVEDYATMPCGTQTGRFRQSSPGTPWDNGSSKPWSIVERPWVTHPEFPARKHTRTLKSNLQIRYGWGIWLWGYPHKCSKGLAGAQPVFPGHLKGGIRTPKWTGAVSEPPSDQLKVTELLGLCNCF